MQQFLQAKEQYPDAFVFFRLGDFYELFFDDAVRAAELLDLALTSRGSDPSGQPIPMAGVPHHAAAGYVTKLLGLGQKVAICEQMADPKTVKGVVPREVVRVITPGLCLEEDALDARSDSYLAAIAVEGTRVGLAAFELTTAQLTACSLESSAALLAELARLEPREILLPPELASLEGPLRAHIPRVAIRVGPTVLESPEALCGILGEAMHAELAAAVEPVGLAAAGAALTYARSTQPSATLTVQRAGVHDPRDHLVLDETAVRSLELVRTLSAEKRGSLLHHIDRTRTPMGARMLRRRLLAPLTDLVAIRRRHDAVEELLLDSGTRDRVRSAMQGLGDLERMATRASLGVATPRDLGVVRGALQAARAVAAILASRPSPMGGDDPLASDLPSDLCDDLRERLERELADELPSVDRQGGIFRDG
ncbi:MAG: DNA mismatch repair protein MutS, partial [Polyangiaceae bacterium]|nr:DNA mismatch repair protein MutS [Polyangiaceae bacterium]